LKSLSASLLDFVAVDLLLTFSAERTASRTQYCPGSTAPGGWCWLERRLRHYLSRQRRPRAGDIFLRRCGRDEGQFSHALWNAEALQVAKDLDIKVENLLTSAAG